MKLIEPYRPLFTLGLLHSIIGTAVWIDYGLIHTDSTYPAFNHTLFMMGGFLLSFVCGFVMTAIPKFTSTQDASHKEIASTFIPQFLLLGTLFLPGSESWAALLPLFTLIMLIRFAISRVINKKNPLPPSFLFLGVGFACGVVGLLLYYLKPDLPLGKNLFLEGMLLSFVIGVGSRLLPALFGRQPAPNSPEAKTMQHKGKQIFIALAILFFISFFIEQFANVFLGRLIRTLIITLVAFRFWQIQKLPKTPTKMNFWLLVSCWFIFIGIVGYTLFQAYAIHFIHLTFVSGFGLMTLMVATRVSLAHGGFSQKLESTGRFYKFVAWFFIAAAITRLTAPIIPKIYLKHLAYASMSWITGILIWSYYFVPKLVLPKKVGHEDEQC